MGVGHVPQEPIRSPGEDPLVQGRERRGTARSRDLAAARRARGAWGENLVASWYVRNGWRIVARNVRHGRGEVDIIAEQRGIFAVCEVKTRRNNNYGFAAEAMTPAKCRTVRRAAFGWARDNGVPSSQLRFDAAFVVGTSIDVVENCY